VYCGLVGSVINFLESIGVELDLTPKGNFLPRDWFYKYANPQKVVKSRRICFKGPNKDNPAQFLDFEILPSLA
jgi:hypothetical protein